MVLLHIDIVPDGDIDHGLVFFIGGENTADGIGILRVEALPGPIAVGDQGILPHRQGQGQTVSHGQAQILGHRLRDQAALAACGIVCALCQGQIPLLKGQQVRRPVRGLHRQGVGRDLIGLGHLSMPVEPSSLGGVPSGWVTSSTSVTPVSTPSSSYCPMDSCMYDAPIRLDSA